MKIFEYYAQRREALARMETIRNIAEEENRLLTTEENREFHELTERINQIDQFIEMERQHGGTVDDPFYRGRNALNFSQETPWVDKRGNPINIYSNGRNPRVSTAAGPSLGRFLRFAAGLGDDPEVRAMSSTDANGGYTIPAYLMPGFIQKLGPESTVLKLGAKVLQLESDTSFSKVATWPTVYYPGEGAEITVTDVTFSQVPFTPKTPAFIVKASRELMEDSANLEEVLSDTFAKTFAAELDRVALLGASGTEGITGVKNLTGLSTGYDMLNTVFSDYKPLMQTVKNIMLNNAKPNGLVMNPKVYIDIMSLVDGEDNPLQMPEILKALNWQTTTAITAASESEIYMGDFTQLMIGIRLNQMRIVPLTERYAEYNQVGFLVYGRWDVRATDAKNFAKIVNINFSSVDS